MSKGESIIIIGSGLGGLICGAILSREGYKVTVLERNRQIGGNLQTFSRDKHIFDSGVHYVGALDKGQNLYMVFKYLGIIDKVKLEKMDEAAYDKIIFENDDQVYPLAQGYDNFKHRLLHCFPDEEDAINKYCDMIRMVCSRFPLYNLREGDYMEKSDVLEIDTKGYLDSLTDNKKLKGVLAGNSSLYAGVADKTPFYVHALINNSYINSSWRFVDGGSIIARLLSDIIKTNGGEVINRTQVVKLHGENGKIDYAETTDNRKFYADHFISNAHPVKTLQMAESAGVRNSFRKRIESLENSTSFFIANVTLKPGKFRYEKSNYYYFKSEDVWDVFQYDDESWPQFFGMFYSVNTKTNEYADGLTILSYMNIEEVAKWIDTFNTAGYPADRGRDYEEFKRKKAAKLFDEVEKKFPGFKESILNYYTSTPLTFRDYMGTQDGSVYGIMKDYKNPLKTFISPRTKIENLYLTGQNINLHGILGVTISSLVTCSLFVGMGALLEKIRLAQNE